MPQIRQLFLIGHTHHDVGYTNSPRVIDRQHRRIVSRVLDLCDEHNRPGPVQFRWTFEVSRPVLRFIDEASPDDLERLRRLVEADRISVTGGYLNMTQLPSQAEFDVTYDALGAMADAGIRVRTQQHGDVNGIAWGVVPAMRRAGIRRLVMALNPDHGRAPFAQPSGFWWGGPDGEPVFTWLSTHYGYGEEWGIVDGDVQTAERSIAAFVRSLESRDDYPFDAAIVHAGNDNRWPTADFLGVVGHWNKAHPELPMRTATIDDALDVLERQARDAALPTVGGEWSDWWSHGHGSTAREVAVYREARSFARVAQTSFALASLGDRGDPTLATVLGYRRGPSFIRTDAEIAGDLATVDEQLLLFGEHTWGSWETYSKPHSTFSHSHWNAKAGFAYAAFDHARDLAIEGMYRLAASAHQSADHSTEAANADLTGSNDTVVDADGVLVFNPSERSRREPLTVEIDGARRVRAVAEVPAFGVTVLPVPAPPRPLEESRAIETGRYTVVVDPARGGATSIRERSTGRELVDAAAGHGLGAVIAETVRTGSTHPMVTRNPKDFHPDHPGPEFDRLIAVGDAEPRVTESDAGIEITWTGHLPDGITTRSTLVLFNDTDLIDVEVHLTKPESFAPESIFVAFPFAIAQPEFLLETAGAVYRAEREQLPDTSKDWYSIQHAVAVNGAASGVLWGSFDAPLVQLGGFHTGRWARTLEPAGGHINSWLMNNLHFTNFQARQDASRTFRYRFVPRAAQVGREEVRVFGRDLLEPLQARQYRGVLAGAGAPLLDIQPNDGVLAELRPLADGRVRARLRNITDRPVVIRVTVAGTTSGDEGGADVRIDRHAVTDVILSRPA